MEMVILALVGLFVLIGTALLSRRTGIAAPLLLLALGIVASFTPWVPELKLNDEVVLLGILPPILFASGSGVPVTELRRNVRPIIWLSGVMVIIPALVVGFAIHLLFPEISLALAIALGAAVSPIDAVAATSIGRRLGLPDRIMTLLEGESLFNDAAALVTLRMAVAALAEGFSLLDASLQLIWATVGGLLLGYFIGRALSYIRARLNDSVLVALLTMAAPWVAYVPAEELYASGVISVVVCAIVMAHLAPRTLNVEERAMVHSTRATVSYFLEHAVFLLMGLQVAPLFSAVGEAGQLSKVWIMSASVIGILMILRAVGVSVVVLNSQWRGRKALALGKSLEQSQTGARNMGSVPEQKPDPKADVNLGLNRTRADIDYASTEKVSMRGGLVLMWAGMRGVVTLAAIQTVPTLVGDVALAERETVVLVAFLVAVGTLLIFGGSLPAVIWRANLSTPGEDEQRVEQNQLFKRLIETVNRELGPLNQQVVDGQAIEPEVAEKIERRLKPIARPQAQNLENAEADTRSIYQILFRRYLRAFRLALDEEKSVGAYSTRAIKNAELLLDRIEVSAGSGR